MDLWWKIWMTHSIIALFGTVMSKLDVDMLLPEKFRDAFLVSAGVVALSSVAHTALFWTVSVWS